MSENRGSTRGPNLRLGGSGQPSAGRAVRAAAPTFGQSAASDGIIDRIAQLLEDETELLRRNNLSQVESFCERKGQALLELSRLMRAAAPLDARSRTREQVARLQTAIADNQHVLRCHIGAASELSRILVDVLENDASDGTYSAAIGRPGVSR